MVFPRSFGRCFLQRYRSLSATVLAGFLLLGPGCDGPRAESVGPILPGPPFSMPFQFDRSALPEIIVRARVNGSPPMPFLVDTGLNMPMLIDLAAARRLDLPMDGETTTVRPGDVPVIKVSVQVALTGAGGDRTLDARTAYIGDLVALGRIASDEGVTIAGVIGAPMLASSTWQLDFVHHRLTTWRGSKSFPLGPGSTRAPLGEEYGNFEAPVKLGFSAGMNTDVDVGADRNLRLLIDTGSTDNSVPSEIADYLAAAPSIPGVSESLGGLDVTNEYLIPRLEIGGLSERNVIVFNTPSGDLPRLGLDFLSRFRLGLDFPGRTLTLERTAEGESAAAQEVARESGWGKNLLEGVTLSRENGRPLVVTRVREGSLAARLGVHPGDQIAALNGDRTRDMTPLALRDHIRRKPLVLMIHTSDGEERHIVIGQPPA